MKFTFTGCSFTVGVGLESEKLDEYNYCNLVSRHYSAEVNNLAETGNSNYCIFMTALNEILYNSPDKIFVQWSGLARHLLYPDPGRSPLPLMPYIKGGYKSKNIELSPHEFEIFVTWFQALNHEYHNIIEIVNYSNILSKLAPNSIVFINGLLPWTDDLITITTLYDPHNQLSDYTKSILDFDSRDDKEIYEFFIGLHRIVQSLNTKQWVNMFNSMFALMIDKGNDDLHPGPKSHKQYSNMIINHLENIKGIQ